MKKAFTLIEILIALVIIGVLAAIIIPGLSQSSQNKELKESFKKVYSEVAQATKMLINDQGGTLKGVPCCHAPIIQKLSTYLNFSKQCLNAAETFGNCWVDIDQTKLFNGSPQTFSPGNGYAGAVLEDGSFLIVRYLISDCNSTTPHGGASLASYIKYPDPVTCGFGYIDVNGKKGPNTLGKDTYAIYFLENGLQAMGTVNDNASGSCVTGSVGIGCAAKVLMNQDY